MLVLVALLATVAVLAWCAHWRVRHRRLLALSDQLPGPPTLPGLGNALTFNLPPEELFNSLSKLKLQYGRSFRFWLGPDLNFCIGEPEDVKVISIDEVRRVGARNVISGFGAASLMDMYLKQRHDTMKILLQSSKTAARGPQYKYMTDLIGYGILSGSGPVWRKRRKISSPAYGTRATEDYTDVFNKETFFLLNRLSAKPAGQSFDIYYDVVKTTSYVVCETLFGLTREQTLSLPYIQEIMDGTHQAYIDVFMRMVLWYLQIKPCYWLSNNYRRQKKFLQKILLMSKAVYEHRVKVHAEGGEDANHNAVDDNAANTLDKLILTNEIPDNEEMLKHIFNVFTTGQETSANIASFLLLMMAYHPECQDKLYAEIKSVVGDEDRDVTDEDLSQMPYLDMVFKEVVRLFPIGSMIQRTITEDIEISNDVTLPAGSSLLVPIFHIHRDEDFWSKPNTFDPERFSPDVPVTRHPCSYIPFSLGPMNCLGRHFGTKLVKTISARVLRQFRLGSEETYADLKLLCAVSVEPTHGYRVFLQSRQ